MGFLGALTGALGGITSGSQIAGAVGGLGGLLGGGGMNGALGGASLGASIGGMAGLMQFGTTPPNFVNSRLDGPDFLRSATVIARTAKVGSIALLEVYPGTGVPIVQTLQLGLAALKNFLVPAGGANVFLYLNPNLVTAALLAQLRTASGAAVTMNPSQQQQLQLQALAKSYQAAQSQCLQNQLFQQMVNQQTQQFTTLTAAQKAMHDTIMAMLNNAR